MRKEVVILHWYLQMAKEFVISIRILITMLLIFCFVSKIKIHHNGW